MMGKVYVVKGSTDIPNGTEISIKEVNPMMVAKAASSVKMPERPHYEVKTMGGKQRFPIDEEVAKSDLKYERQWNTYQEMLNEAKATQNDRILTIVFAHGTVFTPPNDGWDEMDTVFGLTVPEYPEMRKAYYLATRLGKVDITGLMSAIMQLSGVTEEEIAEAEDAFRS